MAYDAPHRGWSWHTLLLVAGSGLAGLATLKFFYILAESAFDVSKAPVAFLLPIVALIIGVVLAIRHHRAGVWIVAAVSLVLGAVLVATLIRRGLAQQNWADTVLVFGGIPLAAAALVAAVPASRRGRSRPAARRAARRRHQS